MSSCTLLQRSLLLLLSSLLCFLCSFSQAFTTPRFDIDNNDKFWFHFMTRPDIQVPKFDVKIYDPAALAPGYWFIAPYENLDQETRGSPWVGPHIYDSNGDLIWAGTPSFDHYKSFDLRLATIAGKDVMTVIYPHDNAGIILDDHYRIVREVTYSPRKNMSNMHDFNLVDDGKRALVLTKSLKKKLSREKSMAVGYEGNCSVRGDGIREFDLTVEPPRRVFEWVGTDHIGLEETTYHPKDQKKLCERQWDIHHFNSVDKFPDGDYLLSSRHTSTIYKISHLDGSIVWRLGGIKSDFHLPPPAFFTRQHHARVIHQDPRYTTISLFDNAKGTGKGEVASHKNSRGLVLRLEPATGRVDIVTKTEHPHGGLTNSRGSTHVLPNGNVFMGWAYHTLLSEHTADGRLLMEAQLKKNIHTYRAYKYEWVGRPDVPPNVYAAAFVAGTNTSTNVFVSWNGATEVRGWKLYGLDGDREMKLLATAPKRGFETAMWTEGFAEWVVVEALDGEGKVIGQSEVFQTIPPVEYSGDNISNDNVEATDTTDADIGNGYSYGYSSPQHHPPPHHSWMHNGMAVLMNPLALFAIGFFACAVVCGITIIVWHAKMRSWMRQHQRHGSAGYEKVDPRDYDAFEVGEEEEEEEEEQDEGNEECRGKGKGEDERFLREKV